MSGRPRRRPARYVRAPHVVCYWRRGRLQLHNYATGKRLPATPALAAVLDACSEPRTLPDIRRLCGVEGVVDLRAGVALLERFSMLRRTSTPLPASDRRLSRLESWNPAAGFFHMATKDVHFADRETSSAIQRERAAIEPAPPLARRRGGAAIALPLVRRARAFADVALERRTWRRFGAAPLSLGHLAELLELAAGFHLWVEGGAARRVGLRTCPSGGARHPLELYVVAQRVTGVPAGIYHYQSDRHRLTRVRGAVPGGAQRYLPEQYWFDGAAALFVMTAVFERSLWRYTYARAYRAVLIEAGHMCQTLCLTATALGLAPFCSMAIADSIVERDLGIDGISESVIYIAGVGARRGSPFAAIAPDAVEPPAVVPNVHFHPARRRRAGE